MKKTKKLLDEYRFPGYYPKAIVKGKFGDNKARIIQLIRRQKKLRAVVAGHPIKAFLTGKLGLPGICLAVMPEFICHLKFEGSTV